MTRLEVLAGLACLVLAGCTPSPPSRAAQSPRQSPEAGAGPASASALAPPGPTNQGNFDPVHAADVLRPSVALVIANTARGVSEGSGFVFSVQGRTSYLLTNHHVVEGASRVQVMMPDGRHFTADTQGTDAQEDVAVLKVGDSLPAAELADSSKVRVGQPVIAIGSPLGSQGFGSVTIGVVSALHRTLPSVGGGQGRPAESLADVLQTDAPINPGNSGGPLADGNGRVIGMNTAGSRDASGIGFAIPSRVLQRITPSLVQGRAPGHPYVGICYQSVEEALARNPNLQGYGVVVDRPLPGTPAERAGLRTGDVIQKVDGVDLNNGQTLGGVLQIHNPGDKVTAQVLREGGNMQVEITLADRPAAGSGPAC